MKLWHKKVKEAFGSLIVVEGISGLGYEEIVEIKLQDGRVVKGTILEVDGDKAIVQVQGTVDSIDPKATQVNITGQIMKAGVSTDLLGRILDGTGKIIDGGPEVFYEKFVPISGAAINPEQRIFPKSFIQTGISTIDGLNSLARGQKLPIFSGAGLPHAKVAAQITRQAKVLQEAEGEGGSGESSNDGAKNDGSNFAVIFGAMGVSYDESQYFVNELSNSGALARSILLVNLASDPVVERISLPRVALTIGEYLAFEKDMHVLVVLTDMTNYANALREVSAARKEVPGRMGYPGYLYTDLATIYERAGLVKGSKGSLTQIPILSMPNDDKTHVVPDLTGYITEGQIVLDRDLYKEGIYPPVDVLKSLSRLKDQCIGADKTREDHSGVLNQLIAAYSKGKSVKELEKILGASALTNLDRKYLEFYDKFKKQYVTQAEKENRGVIETLDIAWELLSILPKNELKRVKKEHIEKYYIN